MNHTSAQDKVARVLIFRPASLGDTIVSLPCFHLIARRFPDAERRILAPAPRFAAMVSPDSLLMGTGLIHGFFTGDYETLRRETAARLILIRQIRQWKPDLVVHLTEPRSLKRLFLEALFFRLCGSRRIIGMPLRRDLREYQRVPGTGLYEFEGKRLTRCIAEMGNISLDDPASWDLRITAAERRRARRVFRDAGTRQNLLVCAVGAKIDAKDWGSANWMGVIHELAPELRDYTLAMIGAGNEFDRAEAVRREWLGPSINLCGALSPRESAAVMKHASLYLGHDCGPMHLAAAVGVPCVTVFSARQLPGVWFPYGTQHLVIYHNVPCRDCGLDVCERYQKRCITSISVAEVVGAVQRQMRGTQSSDVPLMAKRQQHWEIGTS